MTMQAWSPDPGGANYGSNGGFVGYFGKFWHGKNAVGVEITEVDAILAFTSVNQEKNSERRRENYGSNGGFAGYFRNRQGNSMPRASDLRK